MLREMLMLPVRLVIQILEVGLVTFLAASTRISNQVASAVSAWISRCRSTVMALAGVIIVFLILLWVSIFIYWSFYVSYVPAMIHTKDVNFAFSSCDSRGPCSFPAANTSLTPKGQHSLLMRGQQYSVSLELEMPESPSNRDLGMFMVRMDLYTKHGEVVRSAQRAAMIAYKSTLFRIAETIFFLPLLLFSYSLQKQVIPVRLFNSFVEDPYKPVLGAYIEVESRFIELYKATLRIEAHFTGIRYILYAWPLTSAVIGVSFITFILALIALLSWYNLFWSVSQPSDRSYPQPRSRLTGNVPVDLAQPENISTQPSTSPGGFENIIKEEEEEEISKEAESFGDAELLTLRQRPVSVD